MWFQCSIEYFPRYFTLICGTFSLSLELTSGVIMCCGICFLCWCSLVFGLNGGYIGYLQNQASGTVYALGLYVKNS